MRRIGVDVGGTFTDLIYIDDEAGRVIVHKTPSTPADPSIGTVQGISERQCRRRTCMQPKHLRNRWRCRASNVIGMMPRP